MTELERTTANELDFTIELNNLVQFHQELEGSEGVTCPCPYPEYSSESILVMEYVSGPEINDHAALIAQGNDLDELANRLAQNYIMQVIDAGFFHADPHEGNIIVRDQEIVWIDLGMTGSLNSSQRALVNQAFAAIAAKDLRAQGSSARSYFYQGASRSGAATAADGRTAEFVRERRSGGHQHRRSIHGCHRDPALSEFGDQSIVHHACARIHDHRRGGR